MYTLRPYQKEAADKMLWFFESKHKDRPIVVAPTGSGKSIMIGNVADRLDSSGILILQPSVELLKQNYEKYVSYGNEASIYSASAGEKTIGKVTFATIGSIYKKPGLFKHKKQILIDECHTVPPKRGSMYKIFLDKLEKDVKVIGLTASPFRGKTYMDPFTGRPYSQVNLLTRERPKFFNKFLHITQIDEMFSQGFLTPINYIEMAWASGKLQINSTGREYTAESIREVAKTEQLLEKIPAVCESSIKKGQKHNLVFVHDIENAEWLASITKSAACVHSKMKMKDRTEILRKFKAGEIKTVYNIGVLTTGFDFPELDTIIMARPTLSLGLYMQMIGRGIRLAEGKKTCSVVDMCGNVARFGKIEDMRFGKNHKDQWALFGGDKELTNTPIRD